MYEQPLLQRHIARGRETVRQDAPAQERRQPHGCLLPRHRHGARLHRRKLNGRIQQEYAVISYRLAF